jgi:nucleoside-diphosphate-sugar epimerase
MKVLITGSSGALGRILTDFLISGKIFVTGLDINDPTEYYPEDKFRFHKCSITDRERLNAIFREEQPSHVVHFACSFNKVRNRLREYEIDVTGSTNILEAASSTPSVKQLIYSSSAAIYGANKDNKDWYKESDELKPDKYRYGINKKLIEYNYFNNHVREDLHITSLRICSVVGPSFDKPRSVVSLLIKFPYMPKFCRESRLQFLHSDDFKALFGLILDDTEISGAFNLAPNDFVIIKDLVPWKKFVSFPLFLVKGILLILWNLRILNLQPAAIKTSIYPMILDPSRIMERYSYNFRFSSREAFMSTVNNNKLPPDSRF